ncbi:unnamed protein product, partial [Mesorhabditis belari]|uniref:Uncharacterized protein n=1 Tax=Mesorhabditis belari TaxID=2138241 RepID=A0AAF3JAD0_9BILA
MGGATITEGCFTTITNRAEIMESFKKEQLNHIPTSSVNFLEELPDVVFYAVMGKLPGSVIENTIRQLSRDCYRKVELRRARLPRVYINVLYVHGNRFWPLISERARNDYAETIDPTNLIQHLEYLKERAIFSTLVLRDVNWDMFANCKFECEELSCFVLGTNLSRERFIDIFHSIRPTRKLDISADGDNKNFPVTRDFFTNSYAIGLQEVRLVGSGNAMVDPLNDTILLDSTPLIFYERQIDQIGLRVVGGEAERQNFLRNLPGLQVVKRLRGEGYIEDVRALKRANGDVVQLCVCSDGIGHIDISMVRLVPGPEAGLYRRYDDVE